MAISYVILELLHNNENEYVYIEDLQTIRFTVELVLMASNSDAFVN